MFHKSRHGGLTLNTLSFNIEKNQSIIKNNTLAASFKKAVSVVFDSEEDKRSKNAKIMVLNGITTKEFLEKEYKPIHFIQDDVKIQDFFVRGYQLEDIMLLEFTWNEFVKLFLPHPATIFIEFREYLPIYMMVKFWKINYLDIYNSMCHSNEKVFTSFQFDINELKELKMHFVHWKHWGLNKITIEQSPQLRLQEWFAIGIDIKFIKKLGILPKDLVNLFQCTEVDFDLNFGRGTFNSFMRYKPNSSPKKREYYIDPNSNLFTIED
jgi:hypothetical protein